MTIQEFQADAIENAAQTLAHFLQKTAPDKRDWTPTIDGACELRSALDQIGECIIVNRTLAGVLRGSPPPSTSPIGAPRPFQNDDEAARMLIQSANELADAVRALSDDDLQREFTTRRGSIAGHLLIQLPLRNMNYHAGQINLLQLCYGDAEFYAFAPPPKPAG